MAAAMLRPLPCNHSIIILYWHYGCYPCLSAQIMNNWPWCYPCLYKFQVCPEPSIVCPEPSIVCTICCSIHRLSAKAGILALHCSILALRKFLVWAEHIYTGNSDYTTSVGLAQACPNYKSKSLCAHVIATAEFMGILSKLIDWFKRTNQEPNMWNLARSGLPKHPGSKPGQAHRSRKSRDGASSSKDLPRLKF